MKNKNNKKKRPIVLCVCVTLRCVISYLQNCIANVKSKFGNLIKKQKRNKTKTQDF